jgi:hypothetical protein
VENSAEKKRSLQRAHSLPLHLFLLLYFQGFFHTMRGIKAPSPTPSLFPLPLPPPSLSPPSPQEGKMDQMTFSAKKYSMCADSVKSVKAPINLEKIGL